jgi:predicted metalloprotease with PDZ domain
MKLRHVLKVSAVSVGFLSLCAAALGQTRIEYVITPKPAPTAEACRTEVAMRLVGVKGNVPLTVQMARWSPGDYHFQEHAKYVQDVKAADARQNTLPVEHPDPNTWTLKPTQSGDVTISYILPNTPPGYFSENVMVAERYAFYNGPATLMYATTARKVPSFVSIVFPTGWTKAVCPLPETPNGADGRSAVYEAPDYDTLADSPIAAGDVVTRTFTALGVPHTMAFFHNHAGTDYDGFATMFKRVVEENARVMGGLPYKQHVVFLDGNGRGGGLEHLNSFRVSIFPGFPAKEGVEFLGHEHFHAWNVKRIRPAVLGPFDYQNAPVTGALWLSEGVTSYYSTLCNLRLGGRTPTQTLGGLAGTSGRVAGARANAKISVDEASRRVFEVAGSTGYKLDYYSAGEVMGLLLDLKIRHESQGKASLDTVMRDLFQRYALPKLGFPEDGIREACIRAGGQSLGPFYDLLTKSTEPWPFAEVLAYAGVTVDTSTRRMRFAIDPQGSAQAVKLREAWVKGIVD